MDFWLSGRKVRDFYADVAPRYERPIYADVRPIVEETSEEEGASDATGAGDQQGSSERGEAESSPDFEHFECGQSVEIIGGTKPKGSRWVVLKVMKSTLQLQSVEDEEATCRVSKASATAVDEAPSSGAASGTE